MTDTLPQQSDRESAMPTITAGYMPAQVLPVSEAAQMLHMIERAARDPAVDVDKMDRLLKMREHMVEQVAKKAFGDALTKAQAEMAPVRNDSTNPQTRSKYASYAALDRAVRPIYSRHGFGLSFNTGEAPHPETVRVLCTVSHENGHSRDYHIDMPADGKGAKGGDVMTKTHAAGSAISYGMRYLLKMIFNIATADDDGNAAGSKVDNAAITKEQLDGLMSLMTKVGANTTNFINFFGIGRIEDLPARRLDEAVKMLNAKARQAK